MAVIFTNREMERAWKKNLEASQHSVRSNAHRLLLFYAVECGLKAVIMKRDSVTCTDECKTISEAQHDINKLLDILSAGRMLKLPNQVEMSPIKTRASKQPRRLKSEHINQMWRYGGEVYSSCESTSSDITLEKRLLEISGWIQKELTGA